MAGRARQKETTTNRRVVSFELPEDVLELLIRNAKAHSTKSRHARARDILVRALSSNDIEDLAQLVGELDANVAWLKIAIQRVVYVILVYTCKAKPEDANAWIREHLST